MPKLILVPTSNSSVNLSVTAGKSNFQAVNTYPNDLDDYAYVYDSGPGPVSDYYNFTQIVSTLSLDIEKVTFVSQAYASSLSSVTYGAIVWNTNYSTITSTNKILSVAPRKYKSIYFFNPDTQAGGSSEPGKFLISDLNNLNAGPVLTGNGGVLSKCNQFFVEVEFSVIGESLSNFCLSDKIYVNQNFTVFLKQDKGINLYDYTNFYILYKDPEGVEGSLDSNLVDNNKLITKVSSALNNKSGKWMFRIKAESSPDFVLGTPIFVNVLERW